MADEQTTQTTQEQGGAQTAGGDPNVSTPEPEAENKPEKPAEKTSRSARSAGRRKLRTKRRRLSA